MTTSTTEAPATTSKSKTRKATRKPARARRSPEERAAEAQALHDTLAAQIEALTDSEAWSRFLAFATSFHAYSLNNLLLILAQRPDATQVAGFRQWQAKGRQVRKGERAIKIRGYSTKKTTEEDPDTGDEVERTLARFPILSVFDIAQTDPIQGIKGSGDGGGAEQVEHPVRRLDGDDVGGIYNAMQAHLVAQAWTVDREAIAGETNGYTTTDGSKRIVVDVDLAPAQAAKTLLHEAAHATLHENITAAEYVEHRGLVETEAESVAYVLAALAGLDTSAYSVGYIAGWAAGDLGQVTATAKAVLTAVHELADALDPAAAESDDGEDTGTGKAA